MTKTDKEGNDRSSTSDRRDRIRVLVAEDSATVRELLTSIIEAEPDFELVGVAKDGREAVAMTRELRPDVITMDIRMPRMDGYEATYAIMSRCPTPIVIVSGHVDVREVSVSVRALEAGALTLLPKPRGPASPGFERAARHMVRTVRAMSEVSVVRRITRRPAPKRAVAVDREGGPAHMPTAVGIVASTGGPGALYHALDGLPADFPLPILIVQHIARGFVGGLARALGDRLSMRVKLGEAGEAVQPGTVYLAPDDHHLLVTPAETLRLSKAPFVDGFRPSGTPLFESLARAYGAGSLAIVLTGMGRDGVDGLEAVQRAGGHVIAQDGATAVVNGMPAAAMASGWVNEERSLAAIRDILSAIGRSQTDSSEG